jgi:hypothetical protein
MNWLWIGTICIYANFTVFLLTEYSLWYFFGVIVCICLLIQVMINLQKRKR